MANQILQKTHKSNNNNNTEEKEGREKGGSDEKSMEKEGQTTQGRAKRTTLRSEREGSDKRIKHNLKI